MFRRFWHCGFEYQSLSAACCSSRVNLRIKKSCTADSPSCKPVLRNIDSCFLKHEGRTQAILHHWGWRNQGLHMLVTAARDATRRFRDRPGSTERLGRLFLDSGLSPENCPITHPGRKSRVGGYKLYCGCRKSSYNKVWDASF